MATLVGKFASAVAVTLADKGDAFAELSGTGLPWATVRANSIAIDPGRYLLLVSPRVRTVTQYTSSPWTLDSTLPPEMQILDYTAKKQLYFKGAGTVSIIKL